MKRILLSLLMVAAIPVFANADHHDEKPWFDMEGCSICKTMAGNADMMAHIKWATHKIAKGMLSASLIAKET